MSNHNRKQSPREDQQTVTVGTQSWDALWASVSIAPDPSEADLAADGWKSVAAIAALWGIGRCGADNRLRGGIADGTFERIKARLANGATGYLYRPKAPGVTRLVR